MSSPAMVLAAMTTALVAGVTGSLHCGLMCGPLACAAAGSSRGAGVVGWQLGRVTAYALVGVVLGAASQALSLVAQASFEAVLPYVMAAALTATAFDLGKRLPPLPFLSRLARPIVRAGAALSPTARAFAMGAATPFLPCGLLYGLFLAALATNSAVGGGLVMAAFALGAVPVLVVAQLGASRLQRWPTAALVLKRAVPLTAAAVLVARAVLARSAGPACH